LKVNPGDSSEDEAIDHLNDQFLGFSYVRSYEDFSTLLQNRSST